MELGNLKRGPEHYERLEEDTPWKTGFWRRFPWAGMAALIASIAGSIAMIRILTMSDGQPIHFASSLSVNRSALGVGFVLNGTNVPRSLIERERRPWRGAPGSDSGRA